jgi:hypothetical protein
MFIGHGEIVAFLYKRVDNTLANPRWILRGLDGLSG